MTIHIIGLKLRCCFIGLTIMLTICIIIGQFLDRILYKNLDRLAENRDIELENWDIIEPGGKPEHVRTSTSPRRPQAGRCPAPP